MTVRISLRRLSKQTRLCFLLIRLAASLKTGLNVSTNSFDRAASLVLRRLSITDSGTMGMLQRVASFTANRHAIPPGTRNAHCDTADVITDADFRNSYAEEN